MNSHVKVVAEVLLIIGVHVQLSLLDADALLDEGSFRGPRLDQSAETIL